ncbi:MAG: hypothetical protein QM784_24950 [Polyangiaceae bacterium]
MTDGNTVQENESVQDTSTSSHRAPSSATATPTAKGGALRRFFWMDERVAQARKLCFSKGDPGFAEFDLAKQAREGIVQIGETGEGNAAVLLLERIETLFLLRSYLKKNSLPVGDANYLSEDDLGRAREIPRVGETWNELSTAQQSAIEAALGPKGESALLDLEPKNRRYLASGLRKLSSNISETLEFEANRVGRVLFARWSRIAAAGVATLGILLAAYGVYAKATAKPNIALHRPVTVSSQHPGEGMDHSLLVDGDRTNLGFHTAHGPNQWCVIDLGAVEIDHQGRRDQPRRLLPRPRCAHPSRGQRRRPELPHHRATKGPVRHLDGKQAQHPGALRETLPGGREFLPPLRGRGLLTRRPADWVCAS